MLMYPSSPNHNMQKTIASIVVLIAVALVAIGARAYDKKGSVAANMPTQNTPIVSTESTGSNSNSQVEGTSNSSEYKDGTYSAKANYFVPHGYESITVTLSVKNGVVTSSSIQNSQSDPESARFQQDFSAQYKTYVIGKNIKGLNLPYMAGASDTAQGFDNALHQIQNQAQV